MILLTVLAVASFAVLLIYSWLANNYTCRRCGSVFNNTMADDWYGIMHQRCFRCGFNSDKDELPKVKK